MSSQALFPLLQIYFLHLNGPRIKSQGLQFLAETNESTVSRKPTVNSEEDDLESPVKKVPTMRTKIHRSYTGGISWARDITGTDI